MTTAFANAVRGRLWAAWCAQPAGLAFALATMIVAVGAGAVATTGRVWVVNWLRVSPSWMAVTFVAMVVGGWCFKLGVGLWTGTLPVR